ncbi:AraC family transcriptional regulator [Pseudomonas sp. 5P_3.1_Bac2]|uniref:AraC family transcriptional regulator n=1 Tax=Pseudomonas sp. 5P_3.1_Bac2 TaxID=2971617 RepID=UPI0021C6546C|nr:AraC family transcriptional regulator [Pseudomonas sp. 5P_3.1_Bac2]MCU1719155.1 AraC family transcriptional regulator [Pseudomonas sp. 5P_3.1_Bac2]
MDHRPAPSPPQQRMLELMLQLAPNEGYSATLVEGVTLMRANQAMASTPALYEPSIVIVLQGSKRGVHGGKLYVYDAEHYLVLSVPLPFSIETQASAEQPMLGLALRIDPSLTAELALDVPEPAHSEPLPLYASPIDSALQDATLRLLQALSCATDARILGPALVREITYRVLTGAQGASLRAALQTNSHFGRIAKVLRLIHSQFHTPLDVPTLARQAHLSVAAFHVHFKAVTATSPLQYIKAMRLHQARLLMIRQGLNAASAAAEVGYQSPTQFSREFRRLFGRSPSAEARHLQNLLALAPAPLSAA